MASKVELIKQYRDGTLTGAPMSYLDAAKAANKAFEANNSNTTSTPPAISYSFQEKEPTYMMTSSARQNDKGEMEVMGKSATFTDKFGATTTGETAVKNIAQQEQEEIQRRIAAANAPQSTPTPTIQTSTGTQNNGTQGNLSTVISGTSGTRVNPKSSQETNIARVGQDATNTYRSDAAIDSAQAQETLKGVEGAYDEMTKAMGERTMNLSLESAEIDLAQKKRAQDDADALRAKQEAEKVEMQANIAATQAANEAAEREVAIANEVALQQSNVAMAKLGLTLSTAGVTAAQQIYTTGVYKLAELKTRNSYNVARLKNDFAKTEFEHTRDVNGIIRESENKSFELRRDLSKSIYEIKQSVVKTKLEKMDAMNKVIDDFQKARDDSEKAILAKLNAANKVLEDKLKGHYEVLATKEKYANTKISAYIESGRWTTLPPAERVKLEKEAGLATGTIEAQVNAKIGEGIFKVLGDEGITEGEYVSLIASARKLMETGISLETAINRVILLNPKYKALVAKKNAPKGGGGGGRSGFDGVANYADRSTGALVSFYTKDGVPYNQDGTPVDISKYVEAGTAGASNITIQQPNIVDRALGAITGKKPQPTATIFRQPETDKTKQKSEWEQ